MFSRVPKMADHCKVKIATKNCDKVKRDMRRLKIIVEKCRHTKIKIGQHHNLSKKNKN